MTEKRVMSKNDSEDFENSTKRSICHNDYIDTEVKVCRITGKYRGSEHRDYCINAKLNHKICVDFIT